VVGRTVVGNGVVGAVVASNVVVGVAVAAVVCVEVCPGTEVFGTDVIIPPNVGAVVIIELTVTEIVEVILGFGEPPDGLTVFVILFVIRGVFVILLVGTGVSVFVFAVYPFCRSDSAFC